jgi:hypothetical protein
MEKCKKMGVWESGEDGISLISLGRDGNVLDDASGNYILGSGWK